MPPVLAFSDPLIRDASIRVRLMRTQEVDSYERLVLYCLASHVNRYGLFWPSRETIAKETSLTVRGVTRILARLEEKRILYRVKRGGKYPGDCARYVWCFYPTDAAAKVFAAIDTTTQVQRLMSKAEAESLRLKSSKRQLIAAMQSNLRLAKIDILIRAGIESDVAI